MKHFTLGCLILFVFQMSGFVHADVTVTIQPSEDLNDVVWTVSWDSLEGAFEGSYSWSGMHPYLGTPLAYQPWGRNVRDVVWPEIGRPFGLAYRAGADRGFGHGSGGVVSSPGGWGVGPDMDSPDLHDLYIFNTRLGEDELFPRNGSFVLTVPGNNMENYNLNNPLALPEISSDSALGYTTAVFNSNPFATIIVTDKPFSPVPEPSTGVLIALATIGGILYFRRRQHQLTLRRISVD